jgi:hypothetical protein
MGLEIHVMAELFLIALIEMYINHYYYKCLLCIG